MARRTPTKKRTGRPRATRDGMKSGGRSAAPPLRDEYCADLLDAASEAIIVGDSDGCIVFANRKAEEMFGYKRQELLGQPIQILMPERVRDIHAEHIKRFLADPRSRPMGPELDIAGRRKDGAEFQLKCGLGHLKTEDSVLVIAVMADITERNRIEKALRRSDERFRALVDAMSDIVWRMDAPGEPIDENLSWRRFTGQTLEEIRGGRWIEAVHPDDRDRVGEIVSRALAARKPYEVENRLRRADGEWRHMVVRAAPILEADGTAREWVGSAKDITERKIAEEAVRERERDLRQLAARLLEVHEEERRMVARELHDEIGQLLTGVSLTLDTCLRTSRAITKDKIRETLRQVDELISRVSDLSLDLRPAMLDDLGLTPALLWQIERYMSRTGVSVDFKHNGLKGRCAAEVETAAYRIVQEALTNVARHAGVSEAIVRVWADRDTLLVRIEDQGTGFDPAAVLAAGHASGVGGMQERAALCGGRLTIDSAPGSGTRLTVELPVGGTTLQGKR